MMGKIYLILTTMTLLGVMAEPPISRQYLPAQQENSPSRPSNRYGAPADFGRSGPAIKYAAPSNEYGSPIQTGNYDKLSTQFRASSLASGGFGGENALSNQYSAPDASTRALVPSSQYGPPQSSGRYSGARAPSSQYGAPAMFTRFGGANAPSSQYGVPGVVSRFDSANSLSGQQSTRTSSNSLTTQFGANGASSRLGGTSSLSTQYGVPGASSRTVGASSFSNKYSNSGASGRFGGASPPSTQYDAYSRVGSAGFLSSPLGASSVSSRFGGTTSLSQQYSAPGISTNFGEANSRSSLSRYEGISSPSTQYGAPLASNRLNTPGFTSNGGYAASKGGYNAQDDDLAEPANYEFSYEVQDAESGSEFSQEESRQDENAQGSYRVVLPDGRLQIVEYEADQEGYRPQIRYEDIGGGYASGPQQRIQGQNQGPY